MVYRYQVIPRTLCFVFYKDEILFIKGSSKKEWSGTYNGLGGHIEKGESVIESAEREIKEESGLDVKSTKLRGVVHALNFFGKDVMMFITTSKSKSKKIVSSDEGELVWVKLDQLDNLKTFEDMKPIIKHLLKLKPDEIFFGVSEFDGKDNLLTLDLKVS